MINNLKKVEKLNITDSEQEAFKTLLFNDQIVIRLADKGSGIVILDKQAYIDSLEIEMQESSSYTETKDDITTASLKKVKILVNQMYKNDTISKDMKQYLIPRYPKAGTLKGNPKIYKNKK